MARLCLSGPKLHSDDFNQVHVSNVFSYEEYIIQGILSLRYLYHTQPRHQERKRGRRVKKVLEYKVATHQTPPTQPGLRQPRPTPRCFQATIFTREETLISRRKCSGVFFSFIYLLCARPCYLIMEWWWWWCVCVCLCALSS